MWSLGFRLLMVASPQYPQDPYFQVTEVEPLQAADHLQLFRHTVEMTGAKADHLDLAIREQVTAVITRTNIKLEHPVAGIAHVSNLNYPELTPSGSQHRYKHLLLPGKDGFLASIIVQSTQETESPDAMYGWANTLASEAAYGADSRIEVSEWQWFSSRPEGVRVRRDFRAHYSPPAARTWRDFQTTVARTAHLRGTTLWIRAMAHYHEGLALELPMYQFLAFHKGCEALVALRSRLAKAGYTCDKRTLALPEPLAREFPTLHRQPVQKALDELYGPFRNLAVHVEAKNKNGGITFVHTDLFENGLVRYAKLAAVCKQCFREIADSLVNASSAR